jgi:hypothetical protein
MRTDRNEHQIVKRLESAVGELLASVVVYGPAAHDEEYSIGGGEHLLIVVRDLAPATLRALAEPVRWWLGRGEPWPRLFSPELLRDAADVFPLELLDISMHRRVVFGSDPMIDLVIDPAQLRAQCERELREKLMRLREGYVESHGAIGARGLRELLAASYPTFARIFRGCLYLLGAPIARRDHDVVVELCALLDLPPDAFEAAERIARGERGGDAEAAFAAYYQALTAAEHRIDRLIIHRKGRAS